MSGDIRAFFASRRQLPWEQKISCDPNVDILRDSQDEERDEESDGGTAISSETTRVGLQFSEEQQAIIDYSTTSCGTHIVVDAVAGSGKTTTICGIAQANSNKVICILTYNKHLVKETRDRMSALGIRNTHVFTVHGFVYKYYDDSGYTDKIIHDTLDQDKPIRQDQIDDYSIIVFDEFQDFNQWMIRVIIKYLSDVKKLGHSMSKLVLLGDKYQCVYRDLHCSDERYLTNAENILKPFGKFKRFQLRTTYRMREATVEFINKAYLQTPLFLHHKVGGNCPIYIVTDIWRSKFHRKILSIIENGGYEPQDIFILAPSIKSDKSPIYKLTNYLSDHGYPIYYSLSMEDEGSREETLNKIVVSTYHMSKGRERPLVIIFNVDASYFKFFAKDSPRNITTNPQYVAHTRALEQLVMIQDHCEEALPFIDSIELEQTCQVVKLEKLKYIPSISIEKSELTVTSLLEYATYETLAHAEAFFKCKKYQTDIVIDIPTYVSNIINGKPITENVSNINGILVCLFYEYHLHQKLSVVEYLQQNVLSSYSEQYKTDLRELKSTNLNSPEDFVKVALFIESDGNGTIHRLKQIKKRDWIDESHKQLIIQQMDRFCGPRSMFEVPVKNNHLIRAKMLLGKVDIIETSKKEIIEVKFVSKITTVHKVQLLLYYYLLCNMDSKFRDYKLTLLNIKDGVKYKLEPRMQDLEYLVDYLVYRKYTKEKTKTLKELKKELWAGMSV